MKLLFRTDGSVRSGSGHVMRCMALAQGWQRGGGSAVFAQAETTPALEKRLHAEGLEVRRLAVVPGSPEDAAMTIREAETCAAKWIVADGYCFGEAWQKQIKSTKLGLLLIDDYGHAKHYHADMILNQNLSADKRFYSCRESRTRLLLGTRYAVLRQEFLEWRGWHRVIPVAARKVLVTMGGSDPDNVTREVIKALDGVPDAETTVIVGGSNPHLADLRSATGDQKSAMRLLVDPPNLPELMAGADVAVAAAGSTSWELAFMGLPSLVVALADNQRKIADALAAKGVVDFLGGRDEANSRQIASSLAELLASSERRTEMSRRGRRLIDGRGVQRVVRLLLSGGILPGNGTILAGSINVRSA